MEGSASVIRRAEFPPENSELPSRFSSKHALVLLTPLCLPRLWFLAIPHSLGEAEVLSCPEQNMHMHETRVKLPTSRGLALWGITASRNLKPYLTFLQGAFVRLAAGKARVTRPVCQDDSATPGAFDSCMRGTPQAKTCWTVTLADTAAPPHVLSASWDNTDKNTSAGCG